MSFVCSGTCIKHDNTVTEAPDMFFSMGVLHTRTSVHQKMKKKIKHKSRAFLDSNGMMEIILNLNLTYIFWANLAIS